MNFTTAGAPVVVALYRPRCIPFIHSQFIEPQTYTPFMLPFYFQLGWYFWADKSFVEYIAMCGIIAANFIFRRWSASTERINSAMKPWSPGATVIFDLQCSSDLLLPSKIFD